jgi:hypothetical protein
MEHTVQSLIGGLRQFRAAADALSAGGGGGEEESAGMGSLLPGAAAPASPGSAPAVALFGECQVYIPAEEWEMVDQARRSSVRIVVRDRAGSGGGGADVIRSG